MPRRGPLDVVLRDRATQHDARVQREIGEHGVEDLAPHVVEVQVHARRTGLAQSRRKVILAIVQARVEAVRLDDLGALLRPAGDPDHPRCPCALGDLARDRTGGSRRARHDHDVAVLHLADFGHPEVRGDAGHAQHVEHGRQIQAQP